MKAAAGAVSDRQDERHTGRRFVSLPLSAHRIVKGAAYTHCNRESYTRTFFEQRGRGRERGSGRRQQQTQTHTFTLSALFPSFSRFSQSILGMGSITLISFQVQSVFSTQQRERKPRREHAPRSPLLSSTSSALFSLSPTPLRPWLTIV